MAINQNLLKRSLVINVEDGVNADGSTRTKSRTYSEIKEDSQVDKLFEAGNALASLMANNMVNIMLNDRSELVEE
ncbi:MAG: DUF1659 domain-containing protein [Phascolarctobacterium sp.]|jgi:hypothetical protein|nr:DUF1659 domain-containing protein [Phascolarctobacterium sp.]